MRVLLTRPWEDSQRLAPLLRAGGHEVIISPVLEIRLFEGPEISLNGAQAILATSANGIRALSRRSGRRDLPIFAVGPQTANAALSAGFTCVREAEGDAAGLAGAVEKGARPEDGLLIYAAGQERKDGLERRLHERGYSVRTEVLYGALELPSPTAEAVAALSSDAVDGVMLFSPRSARIFAKQVLTAAIAHHCPQVIALCISRTVANALEPLRFRERRIAAHPEQAGMLALLG